MSKSGMQFGDGLYAALCGTGSPMPDLRRAGTWLGVLAGEHFFIVDAGEYSQRLGHGGAIIHLRDGGACKTLACAAPDQPVDLIVVQDVAQRQ